MKLKNFCTSALVGILSFAMVEVTYSLNAHAAMIPTGKVVSDLTLEESREAVNAFMSRSDVQKEFEKRGVSPQEAAERVAALSDGEIQRLAGQIEQAPAGGDVIVVSLSTILLVIIILLLID